MYSSNQNEYNDPTLIDFKKNSGIENKFSINNFDEEFNYEKAILEAKEGNHYALAQLGKFYYKSDKPRALCYFDAAIKKDNTIEDNASNSLIYQVAFCLPEDEPKKVEYYLIGLKKRLSNKKSFDTHPLPISTSSEVNAFIWAAPRENYRGYGINEEESIAAIAFLLRNTNKKSNFGNCSPPSH